MSTDFHPPDTLTDEALLRQIAELSNQMRRYQRAFFQLRKAGDDAREELHKSRTLERLVDLSLAEWDQRQAGTAAQQSTLFTGDPE